MVFAYETNILFDINILTIFNFCDLASPRNNRISRRTKTSSEWTGMEIRKMGQGLYRIQINFVTYWTKLFGAPVPYKLVSEFFVNWQIKLEMPVRDNESEID